MVLVPNSAKVVPDHYHPERGAERLRLAGNRLGGLPQLAGLVRRVARHPDNGGGRVLGGIDVQEHPTVGLPERVDVVRDGRALALAPDVDDTRPVVTPEGAPARYELSTHPESRQPPVRPGPARAAATLAGATVSSRGTGGVPRSESFGLGAPYVQCIGQTMDRPARTHRTWPLYNGGEQLRASLQHCLGLSRLCSGIGAFGAR